MTASFRKQVLGKIKLTEEQIRMLQLSEQDIENGRVISQSQLDKSDLKWLKELKFGLKQPPNKEEKY